MALVKMRPDTPPLETAKSSQVSSPLLAEAARLAAIERRLLHIIQSVVLGGVILL